ncbi:MAG: hypothetical protein M0R28_22900 [Pigmentiphaga sp.]|nr:hypothetical protein [Pigmentiphaga sp.]
MADYFCSTVVQPTIPLSAMTPLERLILSSIFSSDAEGDGIYFYAEQGANDMPAYPVDEVRAALALSGDVESAAADAVRAELAELGEDDAYLQLDLSVPGWEVFFQSIVRRTPALPYVSIVSAWTCTKMRPDGFGGMAVLITADDIMARSTESMLDEMLGIAEYGPLGVEPGLGSHVLLRLCEEHVRATVEVVFEREAPDGLQITDVSNADIRQASLDVKAASDLSHEEGEAAFKAATRAISLAADRKLAAR